MKRALQAEPQHARSPAAASPPARSAGRSRSRPGRRTRGRAAARAASTISCQISAWPGEQERRDRACASVLATFEPTMTWCRGSRSAQIPPTSRNDDLRHRPGGEDEPEVGLRAGQVEHGEGERDRWRRRVPRNEIARAANSSRKSRSASGPSRLSAAVCFVPVALQARRRTARAASRARSAARSSREVGELARAASTNSSSSRRLDALGPARAGRRRSSREVPLGVVGDAEVDQREPLGLRAARSRRAFGTRPRRRPRAAASAAGRSGPAGSRTPAASPA